MVGKRGTNRQRFWTKVNVAGPDDCWPWEASTDHAGYGWFRWSTTNKASAIHASRAVWMLERGDIPDGMCVCHHCDNPLCVNPSHLFLGTPADNMRDMRNKGRDVKGEEHGGSKLTEEFVLEIRRRACAGETHRVIGENFGVSTVAVTMIANRKLWKHVPGGERYAASKTNTPRGATHHSAKLNEADVRSIRRLVDRGVSKRVIAREFDVSLANVKALAAGKTWKSVPPHPYCEPLHV